MITTATAQKPRLTMVRQVSESGEPSYQLTDPKQLFRFCSMCGCWKKRRGDFQPGNGYCRECRIQRKQNPRKEPRRGPASPPAGQGAFAKLNLETGMGLYIRQFLNAKAARSVGTVEAYQSCLGLFAQHLNNGWPFDADGVDSFLASKKAAGRGLGTIKGYYRIINVFSGWLVKRGKIDTNPMEMAEKVANAKLLPRAPGLEDIQALYSWLKRRAGWEEWQPVRNLAVFSLMLDTGLRVGEVSRLQVGDINLTRRIITVRNSKTKADGLSMFGPGVGAHLQAWLEVRAKLPLPPEQRDQLFLSHFFGEWGPFTEAGIRQFLGKCCQERGLPHLTPHMLRHGCAVLSLQGGASLQDVQKQLRHSSPVMTLRYLQVADRGRETRHLSYSAFDQAAAP